MDRRLHPKNQKGFTLLELMSVLVIMGVVVSVAIKKFDLLSDTASIQRTQYERNPRMDSNEIVRVRLGK
jgi:prepilin-type N-terminal cleavage/methylation domain-containing protein